MKRKFHRLLQRQLHKSGLSYPTDRPELEKFLSLVHHAYHSFDEDRRMLERAMDVNSGELLRANERLNELLHEAQAAAVAKGNFLANMSHEIRTPLNGIIGLAEMLLDCDLTREQQPNIELICSSAQSLISVINDILDLSKIDAGKVNIHPMAVHLPTLLGELLQTFQAVFSARQLRVLLECAASCDRLLMLDQSRIRQIVTNLVGNAVKFTGAEGTVVVSAEIHTESEFDTQLVLSVTDNGIGIPEEKLAAIFEPFRQADESVTSRFGGTGLGLAICQRLATLMGGKISVRSTERLGSCFEVSLPTVFADASAIDYPQPEDMTPSVRPGVRVLLAEDNRTNLLVAVNALRKLSCEVVTATDGRQAVEAFREGIFDIVLMDCQMPELSGFEATALIRKMPHSESVPIIALTALALDGDRERCLAAGMNDYMSKPFSRHLLARTLSRWISE